MHADLRTGLSVFSWAIWAALAIDLMVRLRLADDWRRYALRHWYDVALVALPVLRPLRLLRLLALVRILDRTVSSSLSGKVLLYISGVTSLAVLLGSLAVLDAEQDAAGALITSFGDAVWWAVATVTTAGYGDVYPVTWEGRVVAVVLMLLGIGLVGAVTAAVASWILARAATGGAESAAATASPVTPVAGVERTCACDCHPLA